MPTTPATLTASEPITHAALLGRGFTGFLGATLVFAYDSLLVYDTESPAPELALIRDEDILFTAPARTIADLDAAIKQAHDFIEGERQEFAREDAAELAAGDLSIPLAGESIHERAVAAALESTGLAALFTDQPEGTTP